MGLFLVDVGGTAPLVLVEKACFSMKTGFTFVGGVWKPRRGGRPRPSTMGHARFEPHASSSTLLAGFFLIEQRYRFDQKTGRIEPIGREEEEHLGRSGRSKDLEGTLKPDLVIHSGDPRQIRFVYDFKFPCVKGTPATWRVYARGPYRDQTQGQIYSRAFGVPPGRVEPGRKGVIR
ncbi:hypothetical protein [Melittangium boletus]|uniref:hypothetical protein n=1 Tax=Melittangium boletus TaxID=83453 RepID=UPI003DA4984D